MIETAAALTAAALLLGIIAPRLRIALPIGWGCVAGVALCLLVESVK